MMCTYQCAFMFITVLVLTTGLPNEANPSEIVPEVSGLTEADMLSAADASQVESVIDELNSHPPHSMSAMEIEKSLAHAKWTSMSQCRCGPHCYKLPAGGRPLCKSIQEAGKQACFYTFYYKKRQPKCSSSYRRLMLKHERARKAAREAAKKNEKAAKKKHAFEVAAELKEKKKAKEKKKKKEIYRKSCHKAPIIKHVANGVGGTAQCGADSCGKIVGLTTQGTVYSNRKDPFTQMDQKCASKYPGSHWCTPQEMKDFTPADFKKLNSVNRFSYAAAACGKFVPPRPFGAAGCQSKGCWEFTCSRSGVAKWLEPWKNVCQGGKVPCCKGKAVRL